MTINKYQALLVALGFSTLMPNGFAEDIDIYTGGEQNTGAPSNVLIVLDNSTNWAAANQGWPTGKQGQSELQAMSEVVGTLGDNINLGLSMASNANGGYVRYAIRTMNNTNRPVYQSMLNTMQSTFGNDGNNDDKINTASLWYDNMLNSTYRYFNGLNRWLDDPSPRTDMRDYNGNTNNVAFTSGLGNYSLAGASTNPYLPPPEAAVGCAKNFVIFIGNGYPNHSDSVSKIADAATLAGVTLAADGSDLANVVGGDNGMAADEWTRFMYKYGVATNIPNPAKPGTNLRNPIVTYTIDVCKDQCDPNQALLLQSMAKQGKGKYFKSTSQAEIKSALQQIFAEIQAVNSVFASATLPVSVNTQGTYENQVYIGVFRPDGQSRPRWFGNLKEYQFARYCDVDGNNLVDNIGTATDERIDREPGNSGPIPSCTGDTLKLFLADRNNMPAIDQRLNSGFIDLSATSFWTTSSNYWGFSPSLSGSTSDSPDGPSVERGGAAQRLRNTWTSPTPDGRVIYTCLTSCLGAAAGTGPRNLSNNPFTTGNSEVTAALAAPNGSVSVTLTRSGNTVTATSSGAHGFAAGDSVVIAGAQPTATSPYNGTQSVASVPSSTTFTYPITELPATSVTGAAVAPTLGTLTVSSITLSTATAGANATVTVNAAGILAGTTSAVIAGAAQPFLNGTWTGTSTTGVFQYSVTLPSNPSATATGVKANCGGNGDETVDTATWAGGVFTFSKSSNYSGCKNFTGTVKISGASDPAYNGDWAVAGKGTSSFTVSYAAQNITLSDTGTAKTITPSSTVTYTVDITRAVGGTIATATVQGGGAHPFNNGSPITVSGSSDSTYNGPWTVASVGAGNTSFTFGSFTPTPASPATGTITATPAALANGAPTTANLIAWSRGKDLWEDENMNSLLTDVRASVHGDVLHSRPVLINYGGSIGIIGFYGSNDGFLRAIKGGTQDSDGFEKWAFIPNEFVNYWKLARLYSDSSNIRFPNSTCSVTPAQTKRDYLWDGQMSVYQSSTTVNYPDPTAGPYSRPQKTYLYAGMRRGGRVLYALDVSDPDAPKFLWKIDNNTAGFSNLGYTWSEAKVAKMKGKTAAGADDLRDVLVFGGGYDPTDDDQPSGCPRGDHAGALSTSGVSAGVTCPNAASAYTGIGRGVYVVDALTGQLINYLQPPAGAVRYSIPADVTLVDTNGDGYVDRIYAGDSGAQLLRWDVDSTQQLNASNAFTGYFLAAFGDGAGGTRNGGNDARKFLFPPEALPFSYKTTSGIVVSGMMVFAGTGDREKPLPNRNINNQLNTLTCPSLYNSSYFGTKVRDQFYGYIDATPAGTPSAGVTSATAASLYAVNTTTLGDTSLSSFNLCYGFQTGCDANQTQQYQGWYINLKNTVSNSGTRDEEKVVSAPKVVSGMVLFATNTPQAPNPSAGVCSNLGQALTYAVDPFSGAPKFDRNQDGVMNQADYASVVTGGGLPPSVTAGVVGIGDSFYRFVIGAGGDTTSTTSPITGAKNPISLRGVRSRIYWYYPLDDK